MERAGKIPAVRRILALLVLVLLGVSCGGGDEPAGETGAAPTETSQTAPSFEKGTAVIETGDEDARLSVEIAETDAQRQFGLMFRESLPDDAGMVFLFPAETSGGFWMKNTLIPLSIAFYDAHGKIVRILDMEPCPGDPCAIYDPGVEYRGALEVNKGVFRRLGVQAADRIRIER